MCGKLSIALTCILISSVFANYESCSHVGVGLDMEHCGEINVSDASTFLIQLPETVLVRASTGVSADADGEASDGTQTGGLMHSIYNHVLAKKLALIAAAASCGDMHKPATIESIMNWTCKLCQAFTQDAHMNEGPSSVQVLENSSTEGFGFTGLLKINNESAFIVSYRRSVGHQLEFDSTLVPSWKGQVKRGLYARSFLGQPLTMYASSDLARTFAGMNVVTYTYGMPPSGDLAFAEGLNSITNLHIHTVTNRADIVPLCGKSQPGVECEQTYEGYSQIGKNVWYPEDLLYGKAALAGDEGWVECCCNGEDPDCEKSVPEDLLNLDDHKIYMGHDMNCDVLG